MFNENITENNFGDFIEQLVNVFRLSSFDKYFLLSLKIVKSECIINLSILSNDSNNVEYESVKMDSNSHFFHDFLRQLVDALRESFEITKEDTVNLDDDNFVAFRMITKFNDLITIDGLSSSEVNALTSVKEEIVKNDSSITGNTGSSSLSGLLFMITFLVISFIAVVSIVD